MSLIILNKLNKEYTVMLLVDNKASTFICNGKEVKKYNFSTKPNDKKSFKLRFINIEDGFHNAILLFAANPNEESEDERLDGKIYSSRFNIIKNTTSKTNDTERPKFYDISQFKYDSKSFIDTFWITDKSNVNSPKYRVVLLNQSIDKKNEVKFYANITNTSNSSNEYAIIALKNWEQIKINEEDFIYMELKSKEKVNIPIRIAVNDERDVNNPLVFILIENPYTGLDKRTGEDKLHISQRILLKE